jgi:hypothetical protein
MIFYAPPELANLKQTNMPVLYYNISVENAIPVADECVLALYRADRAMERMTGLRANWDELGAEPPNHVARALATDILVGTYIMGLEPTVVTASSSSGVGICFKQGNVYADFECFNSGDITTSLIDSEGNTFCWEVGEREGDIISALNRIKEHIYAQSPTGDVFGGSTASPRI